MNNTFVVFLITTLFYKTVLSDIQNDGKDSSFGSEGKIRNIRGYVNRMSHENYFDPMDMKADMMDRSGPRFGFDSGNPDVHGNIERPCQAHNTFCIQEYFAMHSKCKISGRRLPDPFYRALYVLSYTDVNATLTVSPVEFLGMSNARVAEFYINKVTDNLVIAITFGPVRRISNNTYVTFHWKGREPQVVRDFVDLTWGVVTVTAVIPHLHDLRLDRAEISSYADTPPGPLIFGPGISASTEMETQRQIAVYLKRYHINYAEELLTAGPFLLTAFLQYNICDFDITIL